MIIPNADIANKIKQAVRSINSTAEVILYGSRARGDAGINSDWDILILLDEPVNMAEELTIRERIYEIELEYEVAISIFIYSKNDWSKIQKITPFYENVEKEGIKI